MAEENPEIIQQEIADLEQKLAAKRAELGQDADAPYERAEVHAALGEQIGTEGGVVPQSAVPVPGSDASGGASWQDPALAGQVQQLVDLAFTKGVTEAIAAAAKTGNAALVDAFHDILADELHRELMERGQLKAAA